MITLLGFAEQQALRARRAARLEARKNENASQTDWAAARRENQEDKLIDRGLLPLA